MNWNNTGRGVYHSENGKYVISRLPKGKFILMRRAGGRLATGTLAAMQEAALKDDSPFHAKLPILAKLAGRGLMNIMDFRAAFAS
jgi:hypothetical protein